MPKLDVEFAWPVAVAGYEIKPDGLSGAVLVARGGEQRWDNPLAFNPALFRRFASLPETAAACADFASKFGLLFGEAPNISATDRGADLPPLVTWIDGDVVHRDTIDEWLWQIRRLRRLVKHWDQARAAGGNTAPDYRDMRSPRLIVDLVARADKPGLSLRPDCLLSAIDLQFYQAITGMTELRACEHCGDWFECGPGGGRRTVSRFCSDRCRFNFHNERRSKGGSR